MPNASMHVSENNDAAVGISTFGGRLEYLLSEHGMTQNELAAKMCVTKGTVSKYLRRKQAPKAQAVKSISDIFNVSTDYLITGNDINDSDAAYNQIIDLIRKNGLRLNARQKESIVISVMRAGEDISD